MFETPRRGRQARNFTTNVPKILVLKSSSEQIFSRKLPSGAPAILRGILEEKYSKWVKLKDLWAKEFLPNIWMEIRNKFESLKASIQNLKRGFDELEKTRIFISSTLLMPRLLMFSSICWIWLLTPSLCSLRSLIESRILKNTMRVWEARSNRSRKT